jgi:hypothetical protein
VQHDTRQDPLQRPGVEVAAADSSEVEEDGLQERSLSSSSTSAVMCRFCSS